MPTPTKGLIAIHTASLILSLTGFFANKIALPAIDIIFWRCLIAGGLLLLGLQLWRLPKQNMNKMQIALLLLCGMLAAAHWSSFFQAMQSSGWAIGTLALFTFPMMTVLLEPIFNKSAILTRLDIALAGLMVLGIAGLVWPDLAAGNGLNVGVLYGLGSALVWSCRNILYRQHLSHFSPWRMMQWQLIIACACMLPFISVGVASILPNDWLLIAVLAIAITALPHGLLLYSMQQLSAKTASLIACLQPLYAVVLASLILQEQLHWQVLAGGLLIMCAALIETRFSAKR